MSERVKAQVSEYLASSADPSLATQTCNVAPTRNAALRLRASFCPREVQLLEEISRAKSKGALCVVRYNPSPT